MRIFVEGHEQCSGSGFEWQPIGTIYNQNIPDYDAVLCNVLEVCLYGQRIAPCYICLQPVDLN